MRKSNIRKENIRKRKNFFPTLILTTLLWLIIAGFVYFLSPDTSFIIPCFFLFLFIALLFTFSLIFGNTRRGIIISTGITLFLILRYFGIGNIINLLIICGLGITIEVYLKKS